VQLVEMRVRIPRAVRSPSSTMLRIFVVDYLRRRVRHVLALRDECPRKTSSSFSL